MTLLLAQTSSGGFILGGSNQTSETYLNVEELESQWNLSSILSDICLRSGLSFDKIRMMGIDGAVDGFYATSSNPAYTSIEALSRVYFFDVCSFDGNCNFVKRGGSSVATIELNDLVDDGKDVNKITRKDSLTVPRLYNFEYYDVDGGIATDKQTSDRSLDSRSISEVNLQTVVIMNATQALQTAIINHKIAIEEQRGEKEFSLPDSWLWLSVGDVVRLMGERLRITEIEIDDGFQNYKATYDRKSSYTSTINGVRPGGIITPPTLIVGDTTLQFIDSAIIRDSDDELGYYVGIGGASEAWTGAFVELSLDGGMTYLQSLNASVGSIMGDLTEILPTFNVEYPDDRNVITVQLLGNKGDLPNSTLQEMMNRSNMAIVGNEIINFSEATEISNGLWQLSYLLRGRKGSAVSSHAVGTRFVMLDRSKLAFVHAELYELGKNLTFRATTYGATNSIVTTVTFNGVSQKERTPAYLQAKRSGGNIIITWQGVGRLGGGASIGMGKYFTGYRVMINGTPQDTTNQTLTVTDPGGSVIIGVQQINSLTGVGLAVSVTI